MLGFSFGLKGMAIAAAVAFIIGGASGMRVEKKFSDAAKYKALTAAYQKVITTLQGRISTTTTAAKADQDRAALAESKRAAAEETANALKARIDEGACFTADDAHGLRQLWPLAGQPKGRTAARPR